MKALSLWQPWASLMEVEAKKIETRSWATKYRGPLLICSAKGGLSQKKLRDQLRDYEFIKALYPMAIKKLGYGIKVKSVGERLMKALPFGKALCIVDLVDVVPVEKYPLWTLSDQEKAFGDYSEGRYLWITENCRRVDPVPIRGRQRVFNVPASVIKKLTVTA